MADKRRPYYPLFLDIEGRSVVVIGGGAVAARKVETLRRYGARITVIAPEFSPEIEACAAGGDTVLRRKRYEADDLDGAFVVIAATNDHGINQAVAADARERHVLANVINDTALCDFIVPAVIENGSIQVAVSTGGHSPALARRLKRDLQQVAGPEYSEVNDILGSLRGPAKDTLATDDDRKRFFDAVIGSGVIEMLRAGRTHEAYEAVGRVCDTFAVPMSDLVRERRQKRV